ncbi:MAG TPA: fasciclin domain-containing protein [Kineosporiaceae bacterium]|nr:fasciclin domain-containing protein [Kineosporiaceae bacterium]
MSVLTDGRVPVTAFIPDDNAFRLLVLSLTGKNVRSEQAVFQAVAGLGIPTVERVLLYHVVPGATITAKRALKADGARLTTAAGPTVKVRVIGRTIYLQDKDPNARNPRVIVPDVNKGNKQIAHAIDRVLRPFDLPPVATKH